MLSKGVANSGVWSPGKWWSDMKGAPIPIKCFYLI